MGRRKIAIEPIVDERNRTVTFIKRKAGLFKKAHELAVLCQVDVAVIILGANNTFYEFSSVDTDDLIDHYQHSQLPHDVKGPANYGSFRKKERVVIHDRSKKRANHRDSPDTNDADSTSLNDDNADENDDDDDNENELERHDDNGDDDDDDGDSRNATEGAQNDSEDSGGGVKQELSGKPAKKKLRKSVSNVRASAKSSKNPTFNPLQQQVQRQFHNLYAVASNPEASSTNFTHFGTQPNSSFSRATLSNVYDSRSNRGLASGFNSISGNSFIGAPLANSNLGLRSASIPLANRENTKVVETNSQTTRPEEPRSRSSTHSRSRSSVNNGSSSRPALRVQIPSSSGTAIKSEPSSASSPSRSITSTSQFARSNAGHIELPHPTHSKNSTPQSAHAPISGTGLDRVDKSHGFLPSANAMGAGNAGNGFLFNGLPSALNASPSIQQYFATPLQPNHIGSGTNSTGSNVPQVSHPHGYLMQKHIHLAQQQQQQQQQQQHQQHQQHQQQQQHQHQQLRSHNPAVVGQVTDTGSGPLTGSLPSKFANDLMVASPGSSMSMFQDWGYGRAVGANGSGAQTAGAAETNPNAPPNVSNGSSGLTPYINANQTPLSSKYFIFGDPNDDKDKKA
ncbi:LANO_0E08284g1_1 [Lachancea nothofagi CBS 11611]|uniref:LANO_0E08284g1_1 n=1 Tax=Lachancea nothofagi CBS 11611 TaxID=1266666 RepID=A0A1G4JV98_9SACH|nr:LANO_0E08284g1_1 [Lachancea nothofagi CBS 11611]